MAPKRVGAKAGNGPDSGSREAALHQKLCNNIIDPNIKVRFRSLINRDNKKDACTLKDPKLGLTLLQIAVIADNVAAGQQFFLSCHSAVLCIVLSSCMSAFVCHGCKAYVTVLFVHLHGFWPTSAMTVKLVPW